MLKVSIFMKPFLVYATQNSKDSLSLYASYRFWLYIKLSDGLFRISKTLDLRKIKLSGCLEVSSGLSLSALKPGEWGVF